MKQRSPIVFIFLTVFIDLLGAGIILPLLPYYVKLIETSADPALLAYQALIVGALAASFSLFQFLFTPILGALSDRYGRRPVLLLSLFGTGVSYIVFGMADKLLPLGVGVVLAVLFAARILDGITGGNISTAQAYIADITKPEDRSKTLGLIGAAFGMGFMLGPALGGILAQISLATPAFVAAALALANTAFGYFTLPESLPPERRTLQPLGKLNPVSRLRGLFAHPAIRSLLFGSILLNLAFAGLQSNFAVFTDRRFGYGPSDNAWIFAFLGLMAVIVQGGLIRQLLPKFGEAKLAVVGLGLMTVAYALLTIVNQSWMLFPVIGVLAFGSGLTTPSLTGLISRRVSPQQQGQTLGGVQALTSLTMIIGPLFAGFVFDAIGATAPYFFGAILVGLALLTIGQALRGDVFGQDQEIRRPGDQEAGMIG